VITVYILYIAVVAILVLNLLIAVMNNSYNLMLARQSSEWSRQRCRIIVDQPTFLRGFDKNYISFLVRNVNEIMKSSESK
jgi:hypothetical protein